MEKLLDLVYSPYSTNWTEQIKSAYDELFSSGGGRYPEKAKSKVTLRAPMFSSGEKVPFAALIDPSNPDSGAYGGMSFVICPVDEGPALIGLFVGTQGLSPDEDVLGRPGHGRKVAAICKWLNAVYGKGKMVAWAKQDPARVDVDVPGNIKMQYMDYKSIFDKYGRVIYGFYSPTDDREATMRSLCAFLDLMFAERGITPLKPSERQSEEIKEEYYTHMLPNIDKNMVKDLLDKRKYVVIQGPPGTGKTRLATKLLKEEYGNNGTTIQFHPNTTYENFVGGLAPVYTESGIGFQFAPKKGFLMEAAEKAAAKPKELFLLNIDEINRADLAKILGEAIFLLEPEEEDRSVSLAYNFGEPYYDKLRLPPNLHILGTMNSSDRSIAIVDIAVRRRFAFIKLWPQVEVVKQYGCELMQEAFIDLLSIFVDYADKESLDLMPGHSYFLEKDKVQAVKALKVNLAPLLEEYITQGYVASFADSIGAYLQWIESLSE